jgi:hypothetical protein
MDDDELRRLWFSPETEGEIVSRLGIDREELLAAWRRLGLIVPNKNSRVDSHYDGRPTVDECGHDPLLSALRKEHLR